MAIQKKPQSTIDQIVAVLKDMISEPMTDQSSHSPTAGDVKRVKSKMVSRKKKATKARARPAARKKPVTTRRKATVKKKVARKKPAGAKRSKKR